MSFATIRTVFVAFTTLCLLSTVPLSAQSYDPLAIASENKEQKAPIDIDIADQKRDKRS